MRSKLSVLVLLVLLMSLTACDREEGPINIVRGSGTLTTESREVSDFSAIALDGVGKLVVEQTGTESLCITADENFLPYIETEVSGGKLIISIAERTTFTNFSELTYNVTVSTLDALELNGAGDIEISGLDADDWEVTVSGGGSINMAGRVNTQRIVINGAGAYQAGELSSASATIEHNGAGMAVVQVSETLNVTINGLGSVEYIGDPTVNQTINGLGSVTKR